MCFLAFAQTTYNVNIPTGDASPDVSYFWQSEIDGDTSGIVEITIGDSISWKNADSAAHTVTSGTSTDGPDNIFDSGLYSPGKSCTHKFDEIGFYPYYCLVHPWMDGAVIVIGASHLFQMLEMMQVMESLPLMLSMISIGYCPLPQ